MRFAAVALGTLLLAGCQAAPDPKAQDAAAAPQTNYDYRYAFRAPGNRIDALQKSHANACEQLGPARCRIVSLRYDVDKQNRASGVLSLTLNPAVARAFGNAATDSTVRSGGALVSAEIRDDAAASSVPARLKRAADDADAKAKTASDPDQRAALTASAAKARGAIATLAEIDRTSGPLLATAPVLIDYSAGTGAGVGGATFDGAGETLLSSLAGLATIVAGIGPWLVLLIGGALLLRRLIPADSAPVPARQEAPGMLQRWFDRDQPEHERPREDA